MADIDQLQGKTFNVDTETTGFYAGFSKTVVVGAKVLIGLFVVYAALFPVQAATTLSSAQSWTTAEFGGWYIWVTAFYTFTCFAIALWPRSGRIRLGGADARPEFSRFSWFSMMFGAGIGVGMLTYSTAEPIYHFANNPDVIKGLADGQNVNNVRFAYKWAILHYGFTPWACYGIVGMALGYFAYNRNMPLSFRSALTPLFGNLLRGPLGHIVDIVAMV